MPGAIEPLDTQEWARRAAAGPKRRESPSRGDLRGLAAERFSRDERRDIAAFLRKSPGGDLDDYARMQRWRHENPDATVTDWVRLEASRGR